MLQFDALTELDETTISSGLLEGPVSLGDPTEFHLGLFVRMREVR